MVEELPIALGEENLLVVKPSIAHAVVGGKAPIQLYLIQISFDQDEKKNLPGELRIPQSSFQSRNHELDHSKGFFADLMRQENHNCWLIGTDRAKYKSTEFCFAYMILNNEEDAKKMGHRDTMHYHSKSTEWYLTFQGELELEVAGENTRVPEHHLLRIAEKVPHNLNRFAYPFRGLTMRTAILNDMVELNPNERRIAHP